MKKENDEENETVQRKLLELKKAKKDFKETAAASETI